MPGPRDGTRRLQDALRDSQARLAQHVEGLERADPVAVHQARVACRRLRALLKTFKPYFNEAHAAGYRQVLGRLATTLNDLRELDVLAARPELRDPQLAARLAAAHERAQLRLQRAQRGAQGRRRLALARRAPTPGRLGLSRRVDTPDVVRRVRRAWRRAGPEIVRAANDSKVHHALRIRLKNVRYSLELIEDFNPHQAKMLDRGLRRIQQAFGDERDVLAALDWVHGIRVPAATARRAVQRLERKQRQLRRGLPEALEGLARIGERWDRAVTRTLKEHGPGGRRRGRARGQAR